MRTTLAFALLVAGCGSPVLVACGAGGALCDVSGANGCCIEPSSAVCTTSCTGPVFHCTRNQDCRAGELCCVGALGSQCGRESATCTLDTIGCETDADCAMPGFCSTGCELRTFNSPSGEPLFKIGLCLHCQG